MYIPQYFYRNKWRDMCEWFRLHEAENELKWYKDYYPKHKTRIVRRTIITKVIDKVIKI